MICLEDDDMTCKWKADGNDLVIIADGDEMDATLKNGILTLNVDDGNLYFLGENASKKKIKAISLDEFLNGTQEAPSGEEPGVDPSQPAVTEPAGPQAVQQIWNGWYYGCMEMVDCEKGWAWANGYVFDVAMYVDLDENGNGYFGIFDPYGELATGPNNNRFITVKCSADEEYVYGESGTTFGYEINPDDWVMVHYPDDPDLVYVGSSHTDKDGNVMGYDFTFMRWGMRWEGEELFTEDMNHFDRYLEMLDGGWDTPYGLGFEAPAWPAASSGGNTPGSPSSLLGSDPAKLDVYGKGAVYVYYPADQFVYDDGYGMLKNASAGVNIMVDPMLGSTNLAELKASYEKNNSKEAEYSLKETTLLGYKALILTYSDWLGATLRVDIDFGGNHDGFYGMSFSVKADTLKECDTPLVWAVIESMQVVK